MTAMSGGGRGDPSQPIGTMEELTCMEVRIDETSYVGLHLFCRISKHMLPSAYTVEEGRRRRSVEREGQRVEMVQSCIIGHQCIGYH